MNNVNEPERNGAQRKYETALDDEQEHSYTIIRHVKRAAATVFAQITLNSRDPDEESHQRLP
jgi:hypothetical protein